MYIKESFGHAIQQTLTALGFVTQVITRGKEPKITVSATVNSDIEQERSTGSKKERKASAAARFTIYKVNKASRKKREKSTAKKERKATKTLAIVLGK
ncbi:hypothetical protein ILUMI_02845 [Ignelater luminosus]|uniref:Uncharacterized protein n=1 Tax=Ignelater luminosus TaxID=2038154 RepID=A0A8K0GIX0_IGNLU|nr:hypothetical protein ILUMI_02845 [Ignelater luminosus]